MQLGPQTLFSDRIHAEKYRLPNESFEEAVTRITRTLSDGEDHFRQTRDIVGDMRFLPAGRVQAAIGSPKAVTPYNCYVSGNIADSFTSGEGNIMQRAAEAAETMRMGGGIGYDFSALRPSGALIKSLMSTASGPISFMKIYDALCKCVQSSGHRRGAQMGVLRVDHPDIEQFIHAKQTLGELEAFNVSIAVTDEFMEALLGGAKKFPLRFEGEVTGHVDPKALWEMIMRGTWDWAEPGVLFIDTINKMNNLWYCETIRATNPCGEQPLPPYGACLLGSFNLARYIQKDLAGFKFNWDDFKNDIAPVVRMMDNVVDNAIYPLPQQEQEAKNKRRMGLGITALANAGEALGYMYGSEAFVAFEQRVLTILRDETYRASVQLAKEKGAFPLFKPVEFLKGEFIQTLPKDIIGGIMEHGIRNSHLTSIAPTGTISLSADNVSSSIEPVFEYEGLRRVNMPEGEITVTLKDYGYGKFGVEGKRAADVTAAEHLDVLATAQQFVDSAVSKTINMDGTIPWADFKSIYTDAWKRGCKGATTFNKDGKRMGILLGAVDKEEPADDVAGSCEFDPATGRKNCE